jgi:hypothetical protein
VLKAGKMPAIRLNKSMKIPPRILMAMLLFTAMVQADAYEVLVVDIAGAGDRSKIDEFKKDARQFNGLHQEGYAAARPYFNLLDMTGGKVYFVFGFRGEVQGIHRQNYPATEKNLRRLKNNGKPKYPDMHWLPVEEIRRLLNTPLGRPAIF